MRFIRSNQAILLWTIGVTAILLLLNWLGIKGAAIALEEKKVRFLNDRASDIIGTRPIAAPGLVTSPGLTGRGQIVGLADSGLDLGSLKDLHPDLQNISGQMPKVVLLKSWSGRATSDDPLGHGTHMAATIVGTGAASDGQFKGIAPGASLYFQALLDGGTQLEPPSDLHQLFYPAYSAGVRVHINGWGGGTCSYGNTAAQIDAFVRRYPDFLPLIAAGNSGPKVHSLTSEANSKNALVIGASQSARPALSPEADDTAQVLGYSSRGPAGDGRLKPDLVAPGSAVISACSRLIESNFAANSHYTCMGGSSMAAAVAGGATTLLREWFQVGEGVAQPSAALLKAALINGARLPDGGPNPALGFGLLDLTGTVLALRDGSFQYVDEKLGVENGNYREYSFRILEDKQPFKATLVWSDPEALEASSSSGRALVNNLDLLVIDPAGQQYRGNQDLNPEGQPDNRNNVEQVFIPQALAGEYCVRVYGQEIRTPAEAGQYNRLAQDFALVYGQPVISGVVEKIIATDQVSLAGGQTIKLSPEAIQTVKDGKTGFNTLKTVLPGADLYQTPRAAYLINRTWQAGGIQALNTDQGALFMEIDTAGREGGFYLDKRAEPSVVVNERIVHKMEEIPSGVEVSGSLNPLSQTLWQVTAGYIEKRGLVDRVDLEKRQIWLLKENRPYTLAPRAAVSVTDRLLDSSLADAPYGAGEVGCLEQILPGMNVRLVLSPVTQQVQYLAVQRELALGRVVRVEPENQKLQLESGKGYTLFEGAPIIRDRKTASIEELQSGDHVMAVLVPESQNIISIMANSTVTFGRVMYLSEKQKVIYVIDHLNRFGQYRLTEETRIYRRGLQIEPGSLSPGGWVRLITKPNSDQIWRLDLAESAHEENQVIKSYEPAEQRLILADGSEGKVTSGTLITKNGYRIGPEDIVSGEAARLYWLQSPAPWETGLAAVEVAGSQAEPPQLALLAQKQSKVIRITGNTTADRLYLYGRDGKRERIPVGGEGYFVWYFKQLPEDNVVQVVALDSRNGGMAARKIEINTLTPYGFSDIEGHWASPYIATLARRGTLSGYLDQTYRPDALITRAEFACLLARFVGWSDQFSALTASYQDFTSIPSWARSAVSTVQAQDLMQGHPDGTFRPGQPVLRYELAMAAARILSNADYNPDPHKYKTDQIAPALVWRDRIEVPAWARPAVRTLTLQGIIQGRGGETLQLGAPATRAEAAAIFGRVLEAQEGINE